ncbi:NAD(P)/FAD-dependent oxidoreductase [Catenovulum adriaticum]|uniref:FAD-dependent oxidoreductase n=1 Tax=Catenovulum adriaticum TaxID=2984846 RepID=A0ABY7AQ86_9ALTE|nr:FAD-dependent oxidoreductase [Catenovulum sp. TS8]WAJ71490.1 FAD-dependent oxidoreductase [Catenovulum sp. TS8]
MENSTSSTESNIPSTETNLKIAVIGSGISGLVSAWQLSQKYQVCLFEQSDTLGGHTATKQIDYLGKTYSIDTGFIVFNDWTYPNFNRFLDKLRVKHQPTTMSFSVKNEADNLEYNGNTLASLFAQKRNIFKPKFYKFINEIIRFNKLSKQVLNGDVAESEALLNDSLAHFLARFNFSDYFATNYILAMGAAIWSSGLDGMKSFPLKFFLRFFNNHGLLNITNRPQWSVVSGGSRQYIDALLPKMPQVDIRLNSPVKSVRRLADKSFIAIEVNGQLEYFDKVIIACHSDQALAMLETPSQAEKAILADIEYANNEVILHTDHRILPKRRAAWAAWNYDLSATNKQAATLTYNMNILQGIKSDTTFCVTLNQTEQIDSTKIIGRYQYAHPVYNQKSINAQQKRAEINGVDGIYYCGAYWYNGFHEDGIRSALDVCSLLEANYFD